MNEIADELRTVVSAECVRLVAMPEELAGKNPAPGKWSPKEVIGHLIDSAVNNHARFVRAQLAGDLVFDRYDQDAWVKLQQYDGRDWDDIVTLWQSLNVHIACLIERMPPEMLSLQRTVHNLDEIAWRTVPKEEAATLEYLVRDYIAHMRHHLAQIR